MFPLFSSLFHLSYFSGHRSLFLFSRSSLLFPVYAIPAHDCLPSWLTLYFDSFLLSSCLSRAYLSFVFFHIVYVLLFPLSSFLVLVVVLSSFIRCLVCMRFNPLHSLSTTSEISQKGFSDFPATAAPSPLRHRHSSNDFTATSTNSPCFQRP